MKYLKHIFKNVTTQYNTHSGQCTHSSGQSGWFLSVIFTKHNDQDEMLPGYIFSQSDSACVCNHLLI